WNKGATRSYGYTLGEVLGRSIAILVPPEQLGEIHEILKSVARGERIEHLETIRVRKDGERVKESLTVSPLRDSSGTILGASLVAAHDAAPPQASESTARLSTILACTDDAILDETLDAAILSWNPGAEKLYGYSAEEA